MAQGAISGGNPVEDVHTRTTTTGPQSQAVVVGIDGSDLVVPASAVRGLKVDPSGQNLVTGRLTIATAGTPVQFPTITTKDVFVVGLPTNTQRVTIGDANVNADNANLQGIPLEPLQGISLPIVALNFLYLDVLGDGHGVSYTYTT